MNKSLTKQGGVVLILGLILMSSLLGIAALAIDVGFYFLTQNKLQNAVDAAALAGAGVIYRATNFTIAGFPSTLPTINSSSTIQAAVTNALTVNGFLSITPTINVDWWNNLSPAGAYKYPAVQVTVSSYSIPTFFAKTLGIDTMPITATATAMVSYPQSAVPAAPFAVSYCTIYNGWDLAAGTLLAGGDPNFVLAGNGQANGESICTTNLNSITGTIAINSTRLTIPYNREVKKITINTLLCDPSKALGDCSKNSNTWSSVTQVNGSSIASICQSDPCVYTLSTKASTALNRANISATSFSTGNWTPLVYSTSNVGESTISSYIPPTITIIPTVSIGQEIRVQTGTTASTYAAIQFPGYYALIIINGLPCASGTSCAGASGDINFPLTGVNLAPTGNYTNDNYPVIGFACAYISSVVSTGNNKNITGNLVSSGNCPLSGRGGATNFYGALLPPVLTN